MNAIKNAKSRPQQDITALQRNFEDHTRMLADAINNRRWDRTRPPWSSKTDADKTINIWKNFIARHPDFHIHIAGISSNVNPSGSFAEVYVNFTTTGEIPGVVKKGVSKAVWVYHKADDKWKVNHASSFFGLDASPW